MSNIPTTPDPLSAGLHGQGIDGAVSPISPIMLAPIQTPANRVISWPYGIPGYPAGSSPNVLPGTPLPPHQPGDNLPSDISPFPGV